MPIPELPPFDLRRDLRVVGTHDALFSRDVVVKGALTVDGGVIDGARSNEFTPEDNGLLSWTMDPCAPNGGTITVNGTVYLTKLLLRKATLVSTIHWSVATGAGGVSPVDDQCWVGLYSSAGAKLSEVEVTDIAAGAKATAIPAVSAGPGFVWAAMLFNAATPPTNLRAAVGPGTPNIGTSGATLRFATNGTSRTTLASSITPSSNSTTGAAAWWMALA